MSSQIDSGPPAVDGGVSPHELIGPEPRTLRGVASTMSLQPISGNESRALREVASEMSLHPAGRRETRTLLDVGSETTLQPQSGNGTQSMAVASDLTLQQMGMPDNGNGEVTFSDVKKESVDEWEFDTANPRNWSSTRKWICVIIVRSVCSSMLPSKSPID